MTTKEQNTALEARISADGTHYERVLLQQIERAAMRRRHHLTPVTAGEIIRLTEKWKPEKKTEFVLDLENLAHIAMNELVRRMNEYEPIKP